MTFVPPFLVTLLLPLFLLSTSSLVMCLFSSNSGNASLSTLVTANMSVPEFLSEAPARLRARRAVSFPGRSSARRGTEYSPVSSTMQARRIPTPEELHALRRLVFENGLQDEIAQEVQGRQVNYPVGGERFSYMSTLSSEIGCHA
ncbi:uncharacterized protein LOC119393911 [Rhipicephalus sanguineus]|uniref:uncharacterized protein LOC119393911 n=1 Tax=Rhipicephalus sanguineus TaxID=34632 RepID=UPI00189629BE|nr:uncharacterized protein LOC119393911 [Rhipicephalus sanguineus]